VVGGHQEQFPEQDRTSPQATTTATTPGGAGQPTATGQRQLNHSDKIRRDRDKQVQKLKSLLTHLQNKLCFVQENFSRELKAKESKIERYLQEIKAQDRRILELNESYKAEQHGMQKQLRRLEIKAKCIRGLEEKLSRQKPTERPSELCQNCEGKEQYIQRLETDREASRANHQAEIVYERSRSTARAKALKSLSGKWIAQDDSVIRRKLESIHFQLQQWAKAYCIPDLEPLRSLEQPEHDALQHSLLMVFFGPNPAAGLSQLKAPFVFLNALLNDNMCMNIISKPFLSLEEWQNSETGETFGQFLHEFLKLKDTSNVISYHNLDGLTNDQ